MHLPASVTLCEVGLRDGLQNEKQLYSLEDKLALYRSVLSSGFPSIELGSFVSPKAVPQMADTDALFASLTPPEGVELRALVANKRGVDRAVACGCKKVKLNVSASRGHNLANLNKTPEQSVAGFAECVEAARAAGIAVSGSISMPFGSPWERVTPVEDVCSIVEAYLQVGVEEISLSDTSGMAVPSTVFALFSRMKKDYPQITWWFHAHNTRGTAMANILSAMEAGIDHFDCSFAGLGGCPFVPGAAGNVSSEDVVHMLSEMGIETGVDMDGCLATARLAASLTGRTAESYLLRAGKSSDLLQH